MTKKYIYNYHFEIRIQCQPNAKFVNYYNFLASRVATFCNSRIPDCHYRYFLDAMKVEIATSLLLIRDLDDGES